MINKLDKPSLSVIIPTLEEEENINELVLRLASTLDNSTKHYELIFVDDHSSDKTIIELTKLIDKFPIRIFEKVGKKGKSFSLIEGFKVAKYELIAMIDADLQYPPEALTNMLKEIQYNNADIVIARRDDYSKNSLRSFGTRITKNIYQYLFGFDYDVQSGLKLFRVEVLEHMNFDFVGPWTFDIAFLFQAIQSENTIRSVDIKFARRVYGSSKVNFLKVGSEILAYAIKIKFTKKT